MKKLITMLAIGLAIAGTSQAQNAPFRKDNSDKPNRKELSKRDNNKRADFSPEQFATQRTEMMSKKLDLSKSQQKKLMALNLKHTQQLTNDQDHFEKGPGRDERPSPEIQRLRADYDREFKKILSKKQYAKFEEESKQTQASRNNRPGKDGYRGNNQRF